jgi:putative transposase
MNRGAGRRTVFKSNAERRLLVDLLAELEVRFDLEVHAYCLMGNHYHLMLRSRSGRLSEGMKWVGSVFTREVNDMRQVDGAVFRGRFHSVSVERDPHLDWLFRYINANPLELGWERPLAEYPWSGLRRSLGLADDPTWLRTDYVRERFGDDTHRLGQFVERARPANQQLVSDQQACGLGWEDIRLAADLARAPGPAIHTDADVNAVALVAAVDRCGLDLEAVRCDDAVSWATFERRLERSRRRVVGRSDLAGLERRTGDILAMQSAELARLAPSVRQTVSDTGCRTTGV